jgi:DNA polymerase-3 subunit epsilon
MPNSLDALCKRFKISLAERDLHGALIDARLLASVYLELKGGRERKLELTTATLATAVAVARQGAYGPRPRALAPRSTEAERDVHAAFIREAVKNDALWKKFGL